jgi:hypothetical protein
MLPNYNGGGFTNDVITVYYAGVDTLKEGYSLCFDVAASASGTDQTKLGNQVVKPATANLMAYAGSVAPGQGGRTGPCWVDVIPHQKNRFVLTFCKINATAFSTSLGPINAQYELGAFADATLNVGFVGLAAETADTSVTSALKLVLFK